VTVEIVKCLARGVSGSNVVEKMFNDCYVESGVEIPHSIDRDLEFSIACPMTNHEIR